jgi:hypothetical protein
MASIAGYCRFSVSCRDANDLIPPRAGLRLKTLILRWAAEFRQAIASLFPGGGVEDADDGQFIHFEAGDHLGPKHDVLRIAA